MKYFFYYTDPPVGGQIFTLPLVCNCLPLPAPACPCLPLLARLPLPAPACPDLPLPAPACPDLSGIYRGSIGDLSGIYRGSIGDLSGIYRGSIGEFPRILLFDIYCHTGGVRWKISYSSFNM